MRFQAKIDGRGLGECVGQSSKCTAAVLISFQVKMTGKGPVERPEQSCEGVLGGAGDVACSLRNTRKASIALGVPGSLECRMRHVISQPQKLAYRVDTADIGGNRCGDLFEGVAHR